MAAEQDQSSWLPEPPPPRPARRDAAIEAALREFDGIEEPAQARRARPPFFRRPQLAVLVSAMLVVVVGIPAALIGLRQPTPTSPSAPPPLVRYEPSPAQAPVAGQPLAEAPAAPKAAPSAPVQRDREPTMARNEAPAQAVPQAQVMEMPSAPAPPAAAPPPPPPPPAVASAESGALADNIVVTGARVPNVQLAAPQGFEAKPGAARQSAAKSVAADSHAAFLSRLQAAVRAGDRRAVIALVSFPLRVNRDGSTRLYRDAASAERDFDRIFTARVKRAILRQRADRLFVRDLGAMIGDGEVWFDYSCANASCSPLGPMRIVAVNP